MPSSQQYQINEILELIRLTDPRSILDIGIGFGKYGFLSREYLEIWKGRYRRDEWRVRIDGVEAYSGYITPVHETLYDTILTGNVTDVLPGIREKYDLVLLIDVIEHFTYDEGITILNSCMKTGRNTVVSTPKDIGVQDTLCGNPYEEHKFQWKKRHFRNFKNRFFVPNYYSLICCFGEDARSIRGSIRNSQIKKYLPFIRIMYQYYKKIFR